ncbi:BAG domain-containing protein Samui isoform X2 [Coccinella septempunctata]|uniref:BAG domain-containing protein Samui isoform X2 n=1 Tax=Coccinella septempunctata TaxID=41139 RepID=UPI001D076EBC|nr:BAG domain-containing protein Samui isoform X2 [Coccinella septempunctata]
MTFRKSPFTGFPFDDDREEGNAAFRSQLDDIAARHPEFAHHLGSFPFRSGARSRTQIPEEFAQRFTERPFPDRFERFGFPFDEPAAEEENKPYYQRYPQYYPQDPREQQDQASSSVAEPHSGDGEVHEEQEDTGRGRKLKNIQQSNTVDLGQRQEPVDDRNQRSMSAPPPNNRPRFVSSINIPVNQPSAEGPSMPQPSAPPQPQERVIPIHVEGRDEPIIPKRSAPSTSQPHVNPQQPQPPHTDKFFTQKSPNFSQYFTRDPNFQNTWFPKNQQNKQPQAQAGFNQGQRGRSPQPQPKQEAAPQPTNVPEQAETQPKHVSSKPDPIDQIKSIQKDVSELMAEVDKFDGQPKDKRYLYLDEMLTRNLIKLDNIDTQGQENIRSARKEAIKCIEKCISILESKANSNVKTEGNQSEDKDSKEMEVEPEVKSEKQDISEEKTEDSENKDDKAAEQINPSDEQMEVDPGKTKSESSDQQNTTESKDTSDKQAEGSTASEETMETTEPNKENQQGNAEETSQENSELKQEKIDNTQDASKEIESRTELEDDKDKKVADKKA